MSGGAHEISVDVLILGGGVAGLWLLNDLCAQTNYSVLLLERGELGGVQTCHSHVYLHQGYAYKEIELALGLKQAAALWWPWLSKHAVERGFMPSCFGFSNAESGRKMHDIWTDPRLGLNAKRIDPLPASLLGGDIQIAYETSEVCLFGSSLVKELAGGAGHFIGKIERVDGIQMDSGSNRVLAVSALTPDGAVLAITPKIVILAAGHANQSLLDLATGGHRCLLQEVQDKQQIRKAHMLVVHGRPPALSPLTGVFDIIGLFIVSRILEDGSVVWLVSDRRSPPMRRADDWIENDAAGWLKLVMESLKRLAPSHFANPAALQFGVYEAPKAEGASGGHLPHHPFVEDCSFANLLAIWPTKLTLAPVASAVAIERLRKMLAGGASGTGIPAPWSGCRNSAPPVAIAAERWETTPRMPWSDFRRCYHL